MISIEEQQILASLAEISADIKSHLTLINELAARRRDETERVLQKFPEIMHK